MISGNLAGPNTMRARTTISMSSSGPMPKKFIAAGLCPSHLSSVDYILLRASERFFSEALRIRGGDPYLSLRWTLGLRDALQHVVTFFRVQLGEHVVEQDDW